MTTYFGRQTVEPGLYVNTRSWRVTSVEVNGPLPGAEGDRFRRVPMLVMLAMAPLLGLAFVVFLPFIGFAVMLRLLAEKVAHAVAPRATRAARVRPAVAGPARRTAARNADAVNDTTTNREQE